MRKSLILAMLMAGVTAVPAMAQMGRGDGREARQNNNDSPGWHRAGGGYRDSRGGEQVAQSPAPQTPAPPVARPDPAGHPEWRGHDTGDHGNWQGGPRPADHPAPAPVRPGNWDQGPRGNWSGDHGAQPVAGNHDDHDQRNHDQNDHRDSADRDHYRDGDRDRGNGWTNGHRSESSYNDRRYGGNWNNDWRRDQRYDWQRYRTYNRDLYRLPRYRSPFGGGYGYQRYSSGVYLSLNLIGSNYAISDPYRYRLPQAEWPYRWVRYYGDVLLVDTRNGYVVDVIHDFFW